MSTVATVTDEIGGTELNRLIYRLKTDKFTQLKDIDMLINALMNLEMMIGLSSLKTRVAKQMSYLVTRCENGEFEDNMLNVALYGGPGAGKTRIGKLISQAYNGIGYLDEPSEKPVLKLFQDEVVKYDSSQSANMIFIGLMIIYFILMIGILLKQHGGRIAAGVYGIIIVALVAWGVVSVRNQKFSKTQQSEHVDQKSSKDLFTVVSGDDFVAGYLGQTEKKTKDLIEANHGKTIFVDEAYSLDNGPHDMYGAQAATIINRFMSENPRKIAWIFAGYKEKLVRGIFKSQPGLKSRFMWHFDIDPYSAGELFQMFQLKMTNDGYTVEDAAESLKLFETYYSAFPSSGRDVDRLYNFVRINFDAKFMGRSGSVIPTYIVEDSLKELDSSNLNDETEGPDYKDLLGRFLPK